MKLKKMLKKKMVKKMIMMLMENVKKKIICDTYAT